MRTLIIAEAGVNHNGSLELACRLVDEAKLAGADVVKFQTYIPEKLVTQTAPLAEYQKKVASDNQYEMLKRLALSFGEFEQLAKYCYSKEIQFLSTPFDIESAIFLHKLGMKCWKIPSGEITNFPYLQTIARFQEPVILSTGMSSLIEVEEAVKVLEGEHCQDITLLHCTTQYPAPMYSVNLRAMDTLRERFHKPVGYSDHTQGILASVAAVAKGAAVIEKHFTLDRSLPGPDHQASLEPSELAQLVQSIREVEEALGDGLKVPAQEERGNLAVARKSIVAARAISEGEVFNEENLTTKRPGNGVSPMRWPEIVGRSAKRPYRKDEQIDGSEL